MNKFPAAAGLALALISGAALAADLPTHKAPPVAAPSAYNWGGLYGGINVGYGFSGNNSNCCLLYTSPSPRDRTRSRMPSSA